MQRASEKESAIQRAAERQISGLNIQVEQLQKLVQECEAKISKLNLENDHGRVRIAFRNS